MELANGQVLTYSHDITRDGKTIAVYTKGPPIRYRPTGKPRTGRPKKYKPVEVDQYVEEFVDNVALKPVLDAYEWK